MPPIIRSRILVMHLNTVVSRISLFIGVVLLSACASNADKSSVEDSVIEADDTLSAAASKDPWEGFNRKMFAFNDTVDQYVLRPAAKGYRFVTPDPLERGVTNFFSNLGEVTSLMNNVFQWKWSKAANNTGRFVMNTTVGLGGLFDVARHAGLEKKDPESFGQTLSHWGVGAGPYLVLPFMGPSTLTDTIAAPVDWYSDPTTYLNDHHASYSLKVLDLLQMRAALLDLEHLMSGDKYVFIREAYLQRREYLVNDGQVEDDFGSEWDESDDDFDF